MKETAKAVGPRPRSLGIEGGREAGVLGRDLRLPRLLRAAGGSPKLMARWEDLRLNEFSMAVLGSRDYYIMVCPWNLGSICTQNYKL